MKPEFKQDKNAKEEFLKHKQNNQVDEFSKHKRHMHMHTYQNQIHESTWKYN